MKPIIKKDFMQVENYTRVMWYTFYNNVKFSNALLMDYDNGRYHCVNEAGFANGSQLNFLFGFSKLLKKPILVSLGIFF